MNTLLKASLAKDQERGSKLRELDPALYAAVSGGDGCPASYHVSKIEGDGQPAYDIDPGDVP